MADSCTLQELTAASGLSAHDLRARLRRVGSGVAPARSKNRGRPAKFYLVSDLPADIKELLAAWRGRGGYLCQAGAPKLDPLKIRAQQAELCVAKSRLVQEYQAFAASPEHGGVLAAKKEFLSLYGLGERGPYPEIFGKIGPVAFQTIERWASKLQGAGDPFALADTRGQHRRGKRVVTIEQAKILTAIALSPNKPLISEVIRAGRLRAKSLGVEIAASDKTLRNFVNEFRNINFDTWTLFRDGEKALNEMCSPHVERDIERVEVGDILVADGHVLNFEILNPETGRPKRMQLVLFFDFRSNFPCGWEISPTEDTQAISTALRRAILCLGKMPKIVYLDNGRAFRAKFFSSVQDFRLETFSGVFESLGIKPVYAWPYHAESKPVERFFGTLAEFERRASSFIGTSVANKPARLRRNEKLSKAWHQFRTGGEIPVIVGTHDALARWFDSEYGCRPQTGHLRGRTPLEVFEAGRGPGFNEDQEKSLRILLACREVRRIGRDGISLPGSDIKYYHPDLYGKQTQSALVRFDWIDKSRIFVYTSGGEFICEAQPRKKTHPAASYLGTGADKVELQSQIEMQRGLRKRTMAPARELFKSTILPEVRLLQANLGLGGEQPVDSSRAGSCRVEAEAPSCVSPQKEADVLEALREIESLNSGRGEPPWIAARTLPEMDRYERLIELSARGVDLPATENAWLSLFERGEVYSKYRRHFDEHHAKMALLHGAG